MVGEADADADGVPANADVPSPRPAKASSAEQKAWVPVAPLPANHTPTHPNGPVCVDGYPAMV
ncbi:hypothetical protein BM1_10075 [Bipolaris maydis]|nr:hypothetical protein BM1_10075 [Bipolaris maydis]